MKLNKLLKKGSWIAPPSLKKDGKKESSKPAKKKKQHEEVKTRKKKKHEEDVDGGRIALRCSSLGNFLGKLKKIGKALRNNKKINAHMVKDRSKWKWPKKEKVLQGNPQQEEAARYEIPAQAKRGELVVERKVLHERAINFRGKRNTFQEHIATEKNQGEVYMRGRKIPCHLRDIEGVLHLPRLEGKSGLQQMGEWYDNNELDMNEVMQVIGRERATWPAVPGRLDKNLLNKDAWIRIY
ncbi:hypothetical protein PIB30_094788 [Stylosanthes scabra]|uniref:Uncharacterized protein n=1 Tax=Stylosanthes scabra TaxID=79078 RepID=A0ABU6WTS3_9FABA|nr:hypothetical protein [Stylosanthes scabra]